MAISNQKLLKEYQTMVDGLRKKYFQGKTRAMDYRIIQLKQFLRMVEENYERFAQALFKDLKKSKQEAVAFEIEGLINETNYLLRDLISLEKSEKLPVNLLLPFDRAFIKKEPYGVVLVIGAWNYPILLTLQPVIGAIAGGNCAVIKPSENSPNCANLIKDLVPKYLDEECYKVVLGEVKEVVQLLEVQFDYIFATSSPKIGRSIMAAAAKHLTPVTLELGGKSPVYIDDDCNIELTAKRIIWGKMINLGQTCIAPDYVCCSESIQKKFVELCSKYLDQWYGKNWKSSPDLVRMVNPSHFQRVKSIIDRTKGKIALGGQTDKDDLWISPTIITGVKESDSSMDEEIFGPVLPILTFNSKEAAADFIRSRPKPLALYVFSNKKKVHDFFINEVSSGAICCNDVVVQNGWEGLPFGGVGESGMGVYHGKYSFEAFTHRKSVVVRDFSRIGESLTSPRYPPYSDNKLKFLRGALRNLYRFSTDRFPISITSYIFTFVFGAVSALTVAYSKMNGKRNNT